MIKKLSLYLLVISLAWLPVQVTFASSFVISSHAAADIISIHSEAVQSNLSEASYSKVGNFKTGLADSSHCESIQKEKNCCEQSSACSQMGHDCTHCVSFIAMMQDAQQKFTTQSYTNNNTYNQRLTGVKNLSTYRPPCFI